MVSKHYETQRNEREKFIEEYFCNDGVMVDGFIVDRGHIFPVTSSADFTATSRCCIPIKAIP